MIGSANSNVVGAFGQPSNNIIQSQRDQWVDAQISTPAINENDVSDFIVAAKDGTFGVDVSFQLISVAGIASISLLRAMVMDIAQATVLQSWSPQAGTFAWSDTDSKLGTGTAYYWLRLTAVNQSLNGVEAIVGPQSITLSASPIGVPQQVTGLSAVESPYRTAAGTASLVAVDFTPAAGDTNFASVHIYFSGYDGNPNPQLMAQGSQSPIQFLCDTTYETVMVTAVAVNANGVEAPFSGAPSVPLSLDGVQSAPPAPSIAQAQTAIGGNAGWQFAFNAIGGLEAASGEITGYRVYHSESNATPAPGSSYFTAYPQPTTSFGPIVVQEITPDILFYWVSAYNSAGFESTLTPVPFVYVDPGAPAPPVPTPVQTTPKPFLPKLTLNGWGANAHAGNYEGGGGLGTEVWGTNGAATLAYSSPGSAYDGNQATAASCSQSHTHQYAGCIWDFSGFPGLSAGASVVSAKVSVVSQVSPTSGPVAGHADIWYSLDAGSTWTKLYGSYTARLKQTDTITLSASQDLTKVQVMAFLDSHDDIAHSIFEISLSVTQSAPAGPEKVTGVVATLVGGDVQITFNSLTPTSRTDVLNFDVTRVVHGGGYAQSKVQTTIAWASAASYSWTDSEAHDGTFDYYVVANNSTGASQPSDVAHLAGAASMLYASGETIESLQPAQAGADITAQNGNVLLQNPNFAAGNVGWTPQAAWSIVAAYSGHFNAFGSSGYLGQFSAASVTTSALANNQHFAVQPGNVVVASCQIVGTSGSVTRACVRLEFLDSSDNVILIPEGNPITAAGSWQPSRVVATAPANAVTAYVDVAIFGGTGLWFVANFQANVLMNSLDEVPDSATRFAAAQAGADKTSLNTSLQTSNLNNHTLDNLSDGVSRYAAAEADANNTAAHAITSRASAQDAAISNPPAGYNIVNGLAWTAQASGTSDTYNVILSCYVNVTFPTTSPPPSLSLNVAVCVDGVLTRAYTTDVVLNTISTTVISSSSHVAFAAISGLAAGTHTIQTYIDVGGTPPSGSTLTISGSGTCQRIY